MFCSVCGFKCEDDAEFCPQCGAKLYIAQQPQPEVNNNSEVKFEAVPGNNCFGFTKTITDVVSSTLFLIATIFYSAAVVFNFNVIDVLISIFLWMAFASAKSGIVKHRSLRNLSGAVYAQKILTIISGALLGFFGACLIVIDYTIKRAYTLSEFMSKFREAFDESGIITYSDFIKKFNSFFKIFNITFEKFVSVFFSAFGIILIIMAVLTILYAVFGIGNVHKFLKDIYTGVQLNSPMLDNLNTARVWILVMAILKGLGAVSQLGSGVLDKVALAGPLNAGLDFSFLSPACTAVAGIMFFIVLGKLKEN